MTLKPCPFCGSRAECRDIMGRHTTSPRNGPAILKRYVPELWSVECINDDCGAQIVDRDKAEVCRKWNSQAKPEVLAEFIEAAEALYMHVCQHTPFGGGTARVFLEAFDVKLTALENQGHEH